MDQVGPVYATDINPERNWIKQGHPGNQGGVKELPGHVVNTPRDHSFHFWISISPATMCKCQFWHADSVISSVEGHEGIHVPWLVLHVLPMFEVVEEILS